MAELPADAVALVLSRIKQKQCLTTCAAVCKTWQQAAMSIIKIIECKPKESAAFDSLSAWLTSSNSNNSLVSINVDGSECRLSATDIELRHTGRLVKVLRLPFDELCRLESLCLRNCIVFSADGSSLLGALGALTRLELDNSQLDVNSLGSCSSLEHLRLAHLACTTHSIQARMGSKHGIFLPSVARIEAAHTRGFAVSQHP